MSQFVRDMERATARTLELAALVEEMIREAILALDALHVEAALRVIRRDEVIDRREVDLEEECLRMLALYGPVAGDLRRVATLLKVIHELERTADLAAGIARRALAIVSSCGRVAIPADLKAMASLAAAMVRGSLDALVAENPEAARAVILLDDQVDRLYRAIVDELKTLMRQGGDRLDAGLHLFSAAGHLERIADHATNIAEEVVYLRDGVIIRHQEPPGADRTSPGDAGG